MNPIPPSFPNLTCTQSDDWLSVDTLLEITDEQFPNPEYSAETHDTPHSSSTNHTSDHSPMTSPVTPVVPSRSSRTHTQPSWLQDYVTSNLTHQISNLVVTTVEPKFQCFMTSLTQTHDPTSFKIAVLDTNWVNAMNQELDALELNKTWSIIELPPNK